MMDRLIGLLAALVGLVALAAAVIVDMRNEESAHRIAADLAQMKISISLIDQRSTQPADDGVAEGLLALQTRLTALEKSAEARSAAVAPAADAPEGGGDVAPNLPAPTAETEGPDTNCIPLNTRFMAESGQSYPLCHRPEIVKVSDIQPGLVMLADGASIAAGGFGKLGFSDCSVMVFSADESGFADMRVSCTK